ncbi:MAG: DUF192 domain-containing protein [Bdellovibrionales bacterium]|nr:DUF192 domain-containing protein [Bdellovibrionales bacterium]
MPSNTKWKKRQGLQALIVGGLLVLLVVGVVLYSDLREKSTLLPVQFEGPGGSVSRTFYLEIASTEAERQKGLMYRKDGDLDRDEGMIFVFPEDSNHSFWMKNTYIELDMLFVDSDFKVVGILSRVPTLNEESRRVGKMSRYVIELLGGVAAENNIVEGMKVKVLGELPKPT